MRLRACPIRLAIASVVLSAAAACTPEIGDKCVLSTDCSVRSDRLCDTSQPNGYCTQNCRGNGCPDKAACVLYNPSIPGCGFDDRSGPLGGRTARSFCSARCFSNADCRTEEGYICADPRKPPWNAIILDDVQDQLTCLVPPTDGLDASVEAGGGGNTNVCRGIADGGAIEAGKAPLIDASIREAAAAPDATASPGDAGDAGITDAADGG